MARDTLPHSLVFAGPSGVGKFRTAVALAEALNCTAPVRGADTDALPYDACGACPSCLRFARAATRLAAGDTDLALDCLRVVVPDDRQSIKVEPVRELIRRTAFRPMDGQRRVAVVDQADLLEVSAQQALLKSLEEPPPATVFVLVTERPDALLPTIRSRCPRLNFGLIPAADLESHLLTGRRVAARAATGAGSEPKRRARTSEPQLRPYTTDEARTIAALAGGSIGRALALGDDSASEPRRVAADVLRQVAAARGPSGRLLAAKLLTEKAQGRKQAPTRDEIARRLEALGGLLRDLQVVSSRGDARWLANADLAADLARLAPMFPADRAVQAYEAVDRALAALERNVGNKTVADWLVLRL